MPASTAGEDGLQLEVVVGAVIADDLLEEDGAGQNRVIGVVGQSDGHRRTRHRDVAEILVISPRRIGRCRWMPSGPVVLRVGQHRNLEHTGYGLRDSARSDLNVDVPSDAVGQL